MSTGDALRQARNDGGLSLGEMAQRAHFAKSYLSLVETGQRTATAQVVEAYERVLGIEVDVNRRDFLLTSGVVAANATLVAELAASTAGNDPLPLTTVQTTYRVDRALAAAIDKPTIRRLHGWMSDGGSAVLRVNATGILAKLPGQGAAIAVADALGRDADMRMKYLTAVVSRVCDVSWSAATDIVTSPTLCPSPRTMAARFGREALESTDAGARWCSAAMLQALVPAIGR